MSRFLKSHCEIIHVMAFTGGLNRKHLLHRLAHRLAGGGHCPGTMGAVCIVKVKLLVDAQQ